MRVMAIVGGVPSVAPLAVTAPWSIAKVAAGAAGGEMIVGASGIAKGPVDAGSAASPLSTITVKAGAPFAKDGELAPINGPGSGSTAGISATFSVRVPFPSQC